MGYIKKNILKDGSITFTIQSKAKDPLTNKYQYKSYTWKKSPNMTEAQAKKENQKLMIKLDEEIKKEVEGLKAHTNVTLKDYSTQWLTTQKKQNDIRYYNRHKDNVDKILNFFKDIRLDKITPALTQKFRDNLLTLTYTRESAKIKVKKSLSGILYEKGLKVKKVKSVLKVSFGTYEAANRGDCIQYNNALLICKNLNIDFDKYFEKIVYTQKYSKTTIKHIMETLNLILKDAVRKQLIEHNYASSDYLQPLKREAKEIDILNEEEAVKLKLALDNEENIRKKTAIYIALMTGIRRGELSGLEWKDINFENKTISIFRSCYELSGNGLITKDTKTKSSTRTITIPNILLKVLEEYKQWYDTRKMLFEETWSKTDRLFISDDGNPIYPSTYRVWLKKILKKANLKNVTLHSLRHTNITLQLVNGVDLRTVAARAGHSRTSTTTDTYSHFLNKNDYHASNIIDNIFKQ